MQIKYKTDTVALKKIMIEQGISTYRELSNRTNINRNTISQIMKGSIQPSAEAMRQLVSVLKIPPAEAGIIFFSPDLRTA
ncbi:helix-turn-helix domain-containing protein [Paenibacillus sp. GCM10012307]|uniref:Helix-turn-helix transcriptional regulator n=1 Tax=Paenibacillus roseus TaxID=2798579 RepID=A0A934MU84_9BACL|nr:helix-turn-helix transcriptional regulator [Paenibacillus roseus]MBJ6360822.1 helix-turn-helix transcriptional regulator [Paenibacillus roseus]